MQQHLISCPHTLLFCPVPLHVTLSAPCAICSWQVYPSPVRNSGWHKKFPTHFIMTQKVCATLVTLHIAQHWLHLMPKGTLGWDKEEHAKAPLSDKLGMVITIQWRKKENTLFSCLRIHRHADSSVCGGAKHQTSDRYMLYLSIHLRPIWHGA